MLTLNSVNMRVVIVAANVSTRFGGESILPWHYFRLLRERGVEAWLVSHDRTKDELLELLPNEAQWMRFVPDLLLQRWLNWIGQRLPARVTDISVAWITHILTSLKQRHVIRRLVDEYNIDVVHEPSPVSPRQPSLMYGLGTPVVIGPMNGGMTYPPAFARSQRKIERWLVGVGRRASSALNGAFPGKRQAAILLVANERTRRSLPKRVCTRVIEMVENGVNLKVFHGYQRSATAREPRPKFAFLGRLVDWKGVDMLLDAAAKARLRCEFDLHVIGDGAMRLALEAQSLSLKLGDRVVFHGFVPQKDCPRLLANCDGLILPSLYECGGAVVLEAMAMGMPVIATKWGGPADYLDESTGILVDPTGRESFVNGLADAIVHLATSPKLRQELGFRGRARVIADFDWERKIDRILEVYAEAIKHHASA